MTRPARASVTTAAAASSAAADAESVDVADADSVYPVTARTEVRRADRASYDRALIHAILDEARLVHVAFVLDGTPFVVPMLHGRIGEILYLHGLPAARLFRHLRGGPEVCVEATLLDGLVMARSSFHHSLNFRSVMLVGRARLVRDHAEKVAGLEAVVEHVAPGRWADARRPNGQELRQTHVVAIPIAEASAKVRTGGPVEDPADLDLPVWSGVIPVRLSLGEPSTEGAAGVPVPMPAYLADLVEARSGGNGPAVVGGG